MDDMDGRGNRTDNSRCSHIQKIKTLIALNEGAHETACAPILALQELGIKRINH